MKTVNKVIIAAAIAAVGFASCKKDNNNTPSNNNPSTDKDAPVITITTPTEMRMFNNGDSLFIKGTVTDQSLHELEITLTDKTKDSVLLHVTPTVHDLKSYTIDLKTLLTVTTHTDAELEIEAEDHSSNSASKTIHLHIMP